jgi:hypothetical protein
MNTNLKEMAMEYKWWIIGVAIVALVMWNNYGVEQAEAAALTEAESTE